MQLQGEGGQGRLYRNSFDALLKIARTEGMKNLYKGLSAGLFRQATYTTTRLGIYNSLMDFYQAKYQESPNFFGKVLIACTAGGIGAVVGTPAEVALIRMTSDMRRPPEKRRNYTHVFNALGRIIKEEGFFGMWKGCTPTVTRAVILNAAQLSVYSQAKEVLVRNFGLTFGDNIQTHFVASFISAFVCTAVSLPVDIIKTRIQTADSGMYKSSFDVLTKSVRAEGVLALWKGFTPYFLRLGPHTIITFILTEQFLKMYQHRS